MKEYSTAIHKKSLEKQPLLRIYLAAFLALYALAEAYEINLDQHLEKPRKSFEIMKMKEPDAPLPYLVEIYDLLQKKLSEKTSLEQSKTIDRVGVEIQNSYSKEDYIVLANLVDTCARQQWETSNRWKNRCADSRKHLEVTTNERILSFKKFQKAASRATKKRET